MICIVILGFILVTPQTVFNDRPALRPSVSDQAIHLTNDDDGQPVWVVQVRTEQAAVDRLKASLGDTVTVSRTEPMYDAGGELIAYSIWIQR